jgi:death-on-curing protein
VTDPGLLESSLVRPTAGVSGPPAYRQTWDKAAALLHSLAKAGRLAEDNESASWAVCWLVLGLNGRTYISPQLDAQSPRNS